MNEQHSVRASLVRKLRILDDFALPEVAAGKTQSSKTNSSLSVRYLREYPKLVERTRQGSSSKDTSWGVRILGDALHISHEQDSEVAVRFLQHFHDLEDVKLPLIEAIIVGDEKRIHALENVHYIDRALFELDNLNFDTAEIRSCYERALSKHEIDLPFSKEPMDQLLRLIEYKSSIKRISSLADLRDFCTEFFFALWPLFSPRALSIVFRYFRFQSDLSFDQMQQDWDVLFKFGFERLLSRLILLHAVNGNAEAKRFVEQSGILDATGMEVWMLNGIRSYLSNGVSGFDDPSPILAENPIENAILLSIYVNERDDEVDLLERLKAAFAKDETMLSVLNWNEMYDDIVNLRYLRSPSVVFLASLLTSPEVMASSRIVASQYGRGGAGSDLTRVAKYQRGKGASRRDFLSSFDGLPEPCIRSIVKFLFSPGMLDRIANQFPSNTASSQLVASSEAFRSLETRDDLIAYARRRKAISGSLADAMSEDVREKYRQFRFENNQNEGRIRIRRAELAREIEAWLRPRQSVFSVPRGAKTEEFFRLRLSANTSLFAPQLAKFVCFSGHDKKSRNRFAFDNLLGDKLRHNFLSLRLTEKLQPVLDEYRVGNDLREEIAYTSEATIQEFSKQWISIDPTRSFISDLADEISEEILDLPNHNRSKVDNLKHLSRSVAALSLARFDDLLAKCRKKWVDTYCPRLCDDVDALLASCAELEQVTRDRVADAVKEAFTESSLWMKVNEDKDPATIQLRDLILSEAFLLKKQPLFREAFQVVLFETGPNIGRQSTNKELELPGKYMSIIVAIVDNLIPNACKASGLGVNTPMRVRCIQMKESLVLEVENRIDLQKASSVLDKVRRAEKLLANPVKDEHLRQTGGGTGFYRIRHAGEAEFGDAFTMSMHHDLRAEYQILIRCTMPCSEYRWE